MILIAPALAQTPEFNDALQVGSTGDDIPRSMATDASGNIYVTGRFEGTVDFDPGTGESNLTSAGQADIFVAKYDGNGDLLWARSAGGTGSESGSAIAVDKDGNVYVSGTLFSTADFDPGPATFNLTTSGVDDIYVLKLDAAGNFVWAILMGGTGTDLSRAITVDASGDVYVAGGFQSSPADFDPGPGTFNLSAVALFDIYIVKLSSAGTLIWAKQASGSGSEIAMGVDTDASGNVLATGNFQVTVDFDPGPDVFTMAPGGGADNAYVLKLDTHGDFLWAVQMGGSSDDTGNAIITDADDNIYLTGAFQGTADFDPGAATFNLASAGGRDIFVSKLTSAGSHAWTMAMGGTSGDYGDWIGLDASQNVYVAGKFSGIADLDPGTGVSAFSSAGGMDGYMTKLDNHGNLLLAYTMGSAGTDYISGAVASDDEIFSAVYFNGIVDFAPGAATYNLTSAGEGDVAIQRVFQSVIFAPTVSGFTPANARVGEQVVITGSGFSSVAAENTVSFNGTVATVTTSTLNSITVTVPSGATTGPLSVTVNGQTGMSNSNFTLTPTPVISIDTHPQDQEICPGGNGVLTVSASGTTNVTYRWQRFNTVSSDFEDLADGTGYTGVSSANMTIDLSNGAVAGDYRVRVNGDYAVEVQSASASVSQRTPPPAPTVPSVTASAACEPIAITLSATVVQEGEFRWYNNQNLSFPEKSETEGVFITPVLNGTSAYHVSFFDGFCESEKTIVTAAVDYNGPGSLDAAFDPPANGPGNISLFDHMVVQDDGKILLATYEINGVDYELIRLMPDGSMDPGFTALPNDLVTGNASPLALLPDGKIVVGGSFTNIDGNNVGRIARFNADGSIDLTFSTGSGFNGAVTEIEVQTDGKILLAGSFSSFNGTSVTPLVRLNNDGTIDATFTPGTGPNADVRVIKVQSDGKIIIGGAFTSFDGTAVARLARLNTDGTLDATLTASAGLVPYVIAEQSDGKILVGGSFNTVEGLSRNNIVRLNADGTVDTSFGPGEGADDAVYAIYPEPSGKILIGGWFTHYNNAVRNFIARVNPDGSLDKFFDAGVGPYSLVTHIIPFSDTRVYTGGYISHWNDQLHNAIGLVNNECIRQPLAEDVTSCAGSVTLTACGGEEGQYRWYAQAIGGSPIAGETSSVLNLSGVANTSTYYVSLADDVCESARVPVQITVTPVLNGPTAGNVSACAEETVVLTATGFADGEYRWYDANQTMITGQTAGTLNAGALSSSTSFYVSGIRDGCESLRTTITVTITACNQNTPPTISAATFTTQIGGIVTVELSAISGDTDGDLDVSTFAIVSLPASGASAIIQDGVLTIDYSAGSFSGFDQLTIRACDHQAACVDGVVAIEVIGDMTVYNAVSANGDGLNEIFRLEYIDVLPDAKDNKVTIYNRWGDVVFEVSDYDNVTNVFKGLNEQGRLLPAGIYFYTIQFSSGRAGRTGYLSLRY